MIGCLYVMLQILVQTGMATRTQITCEGNYVETETTMLSCQSEG